MADFRSILKQHRSRIVDVLDEALPRLCEELSEANPWRFPICSELLQYTKSGKMVRGALVVATYELLSQDRNHFDAAVTAGAVMELIQSFLLIHDDVMDQDETRRGLPAIHSRYRDLGRSEAIAEPDHFGMSMSICVGDVAYLLSMRLLAELEVDPTILRTLLSVVSREVSLVGVAQMSDLYHGVTRNAVGPEHIQTLYVHKTGRYTFSLPMILGATIAQADENTINVLADVGEGLGYVFQLKDDELGIFADQAELGKPVGSDIGADKKTLLRHRLFAAVSGEDADRVARVFGTMPVAEEDIHMVRSLIEETGVRSEIHREMKEVTSRALDRLQTLSFPNGNNTAVFDGLARYNLERTE